MQRTPVGEAGVHMVRGEATAVQAEATAHLVVAVRLEVLVPEVDPGEVMDQVAAEFCSRA